MPLASDHYREIFDRVGAALLLVDPATGEIVEANPAAETFYGYPRPRLGALNVTDLNVLPAADVLEVLELAATVGTHYYGFPHRTASGEIRQVEIYATPINLDGRLLVCQIVHDVTERVAAEDRERRLVAEQAAQVQMIRAAAEWQQTFDAIESPILVTDVRGEVRRLNRAATRLLDVAEGLVGQPIDRAGSGAFWQAAALLVEQVSESGAGSSAQAADPAGRIWDLAASLSGHSVESDARIIVVARDITEREAMATSLRHSETLSAMGTLVTGVAHEVRNPLFGISSTLDAFEARFAGDAGYARYLEVLRGQVNRLSDFMRDLLEYGKPATIQRVSQPLGPILQEAVLHCTPLAEAAEVHLELQCAEPVPLAPVDGRRLGHVFQNLIENAVQHSPRGAVVRVALTASSRGADCTVTDQGPGFRAEDLKQAFEPFFSRRRGGTGLGLAIVKRVVEEHGGAVSASNGPNGGGQVTVTIPRA